MQMHTEPHTDLERWLIAAARGELDGKRIRLLQEHLGNCPDCARKTIDPVLVTRVHDALCELALFNPDLEPRTVARFRARQQTIMIQFAERMLETIVPATRAALWLVAAGVICWLAWVTVTPILAPGSSWWSLGRRDRSAGQRRIGNGTH